MACECSLSIASRPGPEYQQRHGTVKWPYHQTQPGHSSRDAIALDARPCYLVGPLGAPIEDAECDEIHMNPKDHRRLILEVKRKKS